MPCRLFSTANLHDHQCTCWRHGFGTQMRLNRLASGKPKLDHPTTQSQVDISVIGTDKKQMMQCKLLKRDDRVIRWPGVFRNQQREA